MYRKFLQLLLAAPSVMAPETEDAPHVGGSFEPWVSDPFCGNECRLIEPLFVTWSQPLGVLQTARPWSHTGPSSWAETSHKRGARVGMRVAGCARPRRKRAAHTEAARSHSLWSGLAVALDMRVTEARGHHCLLVGPVYSILP